MKQEEISKIIEKARKDKGLTQKQLAKILGVSNTAISKWENGNNLPDISMLKPISEALDIEMMDLIDMQNANHEDYSKKCSKQRKVKILKKFIIVVIILISIIGSNFITYFRYHKRETELEESSIEVYKITSDNNSLKIDGYLIFDNTKSIITLNQLEYQDINIGTKEEKNYKEIKLSIKLNERTIFIRNRQSNKSTDINSLLSTIANETTESDVNIKEDTELLNDLYMEIRLTNENNKTEYKSIDLSLKEVFTQ